MVQVAAALIAAGALGQSSLAIEKPAVAVMSLITSGAAPPLVTTRARGWLAAPVAWSPKSTLAGAKATLASVPVPARGTSSRGRWASDAIVSFPARGPAPPGANVTWAWQVPPGASMAGWSGQFSVRANSPVPPAAAISPSATGAIPALVSVTLVGPLVVPSA